MKPHTPSVDYAVASQQTVHEKTTPTWKKELLQFSKTIVLAIIFALLIRMFFFTAYLVEGESMQPSIYAQQRIVVNKMIYHMRIPQRDEIIVLHSNEGRQLIKRVVALPGETVEVIGDVVRINGQAIAQPFLDEVVAQAQVAHTHYNTHDFLAQKVPIGHVFVMGDNRPYSLDSRGFGFVPLEHLVGRAEMVVWPFKDFKAL
jgi:signal peptidase I